MDAVTRPALPDVEALRGLALDSVRVGDRWKLLEDCKVRDLLLVIAQEWDAAASALGRATVYCELAAVGVDESCELAGSVALLRTRDRIRALASSLREDAQQMQAKAAGHA